MRDDIVGSDKCNRESECLSFADHMRATTELWTRFLNVTEQNILNPTVVFTTESHSVLQVHDRWGMCHILSHTI